MSNMERNPYTVGFGQIPYEYIGQGLIKAESYGVVACTLPRFGEYIKRVTN